MDRTATIILAAAAMGSAYLLAGFANAQDGTGEGTITTDNTNEGTIMDFSGLATQVASAVTAAPTGNPDTLSGEGLAALQKREGFSATPYADHKGYSIGYGHLMQDGENYTLLTVAQALDILEQDVQWAQSAVSSAITAPITQAQFDALVSFCFNVGAGAFARSTLVKRINASDPAAASEFGRWVYASGQQNAALVARRNSEQSQFESATA